MRILVILNDLDIGGAQNYTISLMNEFVRKGNDVCLRVLSNNLLLKDRLNKYIEVKVWPRKAKIDFKVIKNIRLDIKNGNFNAVISSYIIYQKIAAIALPKLQTIFPLHSTVERDFKSFIINFITYRLKKRNEIFVTSIDGQTKYLKRNYKLNNSFFTQIYNGVDTDKYILPPISFCREKFLEKINVDPQKKIILMVAGFRGEKRHIDAFNAFQKLQHIRNDVVLICVGDNRIDEKRILEQFVKEHHINNILILSAEEAGDVRDYYWSADIFTLTSNKVETFPISVLEAMASGLPVVLTKIGGAKDIIDEGINGFLVETNNSDSIQEGWLKAINSISEKRGKQIRSLVEKKYSIKRSADEYLSLIRENYVN